MASAKVLVCIATAALVGVWSEQNAWAGPTTEIVSIVRDSTNALSCKAASGGTEALGAGGAATIQVNTTLSGVKLNTYEVGAGATPQTTPLPLANGVAAVEGVVAGTAFALTVNVTDSTSSTPTQSIAVKCPITVSPPAGGTKTAPSTFDPQQDMAAMNYWQTSGATELAKLRNDGQLKGLPKNTQFLVHLPSGAPAYPFPSSLREGTPIQVVVLIPPGQTTPVSINVTSCADVQTFRLKPSENTGQQAATFLAVPVGAWFKCGAGQATYTLGFGATETAKTTTTTLRMRSVYSFAATFVVGYDTGATAKFGTSSQGGAQHVTESDGNVGLAAYVGGTWMVGGVDYEDMRWYNYVLNPFIAVNPTSPTKDAVAGLAITPAGGISLAIGMTFHERTVLNSYSVGQAFTGDGTVPTQSTWSGFTPGFFAGVAVDSNVYSAAKSLVSGQ